jgi:hypothetical protein
LTEPINSVAPPWLVTEIVSGADITLTVSSPKARDVALSAMIGALMATPVPLKAMDCGEPLALSAILIDAAFPLADTGLKVTEIVQLAPAARVAPQVFVNEKSSGVLPLNVMEVIDSGSALVLVTETDLGADPSLTVSSPNARDVALNVTPDETGVRRKAA